MSSIDLFDQVRNAIRSKHYSYGTEKSYLLWIKKYIRYHKKRHSLEMGQLEVNQFLTFLAVRQKGGRIHSESGALCHPGTLSGAPVSFPCHGIPLHLTNEFSNLSVTYRPDPALHPPNRIPGTETALRLPLAH
jgi:hypothetical protein